MALPAIVYATDEDIVIRAGGDFADLVPADQAMAAGNDGAFATGAGRWILTSASVADFAAQGVAAGQVAILTLPRQGNAGDEPQLLVVASVSGGSLTLRRKGLAAGLGHPPAPIGGQSGVQFTVATLAAEIARASFELNHRLGIDASIVGQTVADLADPTQMTEACVLAVLWKRYFAIAERGNPDAKDNQDERAAKAAAYWAKARMIKQELDEVLDRLVPRWTVGTATGKRPPTTRFSTRISR